MPTNRTLRLLRLGILLVGWSVAGCSLLSPADEAPTLREVRKELAKTLKERPERVILKDLRDEGEGKYTGTGEGNSEGVVYTYSIEAQVEGRWMHYSAKGSTLLGEGPVLSGLIRLPPPTFRERHYELMQWLRGIAFVVQGLMVVWTVLGRFGLRRSYSPRVERVLVVVAAINLGFALLWGYELVTNLRGD